MTAATFSSRIRTSSVMLFVTAMLAMLAVVTDATLADDNRAGELRTSTTVFHVATPVAAGDEISQRMEIEFHPEVGIGPPLIRTAVRPENEMFNGAMPQAAPWNTPVNPVQNQNWNGSNDGAVPIAPQTEEISHQTKISARYQDPRMLGFMSQTSFNQLASLFSETSRMIDTRHVSPPSYEVRTAQALTGLAEAVANPDFLAANRVNPSRNAIQGLQQELIQLSQTQPARSSSEALGLMQWAAETTQQRIGVRREAAGLEFLNSMIDSLDKYSALIPATTKSGPSAGLEERIVGIGIELKAHDSGVLVMGVIEGGPAAGANLKKGDVITAVNDRSIAGMSLGQAADLIGGPSGSTVRITINRQGQSYTASMQRRSVYISSVVEAKFLDSQRKVGYLRVKQFSESTAEDLLKEMWTLYNAGMDELVLDLRGNPGGLLSEAVDVCDLFLPAGRIVATKGRTQADNSDFQAKRADTWKIPLVVLIDDHSASASEIFAAAIQENQRGVIVGSNSYGKGTVQTHFPLQTVAGELKLTTAKFYSPTGREMAGHGVKPDVNVPQTPGAMDVDESRDPVLLSALQVVRSGRPAQLAEQAGQPNMQIGAVSGR